MSKRESTILFEDIFDSIEKILKYTKDMSYPEFLKDTKTQDAVVRNLEIIGEASKNISKEIQEKYSNIEWHHLVGLRNRIIHEYFGVDYEIIWHIINKDLFDLHIQISNILNKNI